MERNERNPKEVPAGMSVGECYERIFNWHKKNGRSGIGEKGDRLSDSYRKAYLELIDVIPPPDKATQADMDFVFHQVLGWLMEWSYHTRDEHGIELASYAFHAAGKQYANGRDDDGFIKSRKNSALFPKFDRRG